MGVLIVLGIATQAATLPDMACARELARYHTPIAKAIEFLSQYRLTMLKPMALTHNSAIEMRI